MDVIRFSEQLLASAVGSSSARLILSLLFQRNDSASKDAFRLLDDATEALQHNRDLLQIALDQMEQGITVFDQDFRLTCWNRQYRALFDLPDEMGQVGVSLDQILRYLAERGDIAPDARVAMLDRLTSFGTPWQIELKTSGRIIELRSNPMPDGGIVATYADITARVEADLALKRANETLEQRVQQPHRRTDPRQRGAGAGADAGRGGQSRQDALPGRRRPRHPAAAQRRPPLLRLADREGRQGATRRGGGQHRILAGIGRDDPRRRARHFAARRRRHEAGRDGVPARTGCCARSAPISSRWPPRRSSNSPSCRRR